MIMPCLVFNGERRDTLDFYRVVFHCDESEALPYGGYMPKDHETPPEHLRTLVMHGEMVICHSVFHAAVTDKFGVNWNVVAEEPLKQEEG